MTYMFDTVEDFLMDDSYINYVLVEKFNEASHWTQLLKQHPEWIEKATEANKILLASFDFKSELTDFKRTHAL